MEQNDIYKWIREYTLGIDISNIESEDSLIKIGGKRQVPFLVDNERNIQMYESNDIIEYIKTIC